MKKYILILGIIFPILVFANTIYFPFEKPVEAIFFFGENGKFYFSIGDHLYEAENIKHSDKCQK